MYRIKIVLQIHSCAASVSTRDVFMQRELELPIPPCVGLYIRLGDFHCRLTDISVIDGELRGYAEADKTLYSWQGSDAERAQILSDLVREYKEIGWTVNATPFYE